MRTVSGVWWPEDRAASPYRYVPVDVPAGAPGLRVELSYDRTAGVLDLGCFGPGDEFRGWSGGAREAFGIGPDSATPGYLPGALAAGEWQVVLGLHRVPPAGLGYELRVAVEPVALPDRPVAPGPPGSSRPPRRDDLPDVDGLSWLAADLHAHTVHSDGTLWIDELAARAVEAGLDVLAVTDHNTVSHHSALAGLRYGVTLLPGQEITTDRGHANAFGDIGWVDFRRPAADWVSTVASRGGLLSVNHPLAADCAWRHTLPARPSLAEVWHSGWWDRTWGAPLAWLLAWGADTIPVGGSDFHTADDRLGEPTTWIAAASPQAGDVLAGLRAGRVAISESPSGPLLLRVGDELVALRADGLLLTDLTGRRRVIRGDRCTFRGACGLHWLEDHRTQIRALAA